MRRVQGGRGLRPVPPLLFCGAGGAEDVRETFLGNGVRVLSERVPGARSVAAGVWVGHGAAHDPDALSGRSHLLEHLVFKGTRDRSARDIALALEGLGGSLDAWTTREHTSYQARVLDRHLPRALDVLSDLTVNPLLRDEDLALEREVVLEEIAEVEDTPDDLVFELHGELLWPGSPYGRSILGTAESVASMRGDSIRELHARVYRGANLLVAAAGNVEHDALVADAEALWGRVDPGEAEPPAPAPRDGRTGDERVERDTAQTHVVFGTTLPGHAHPSRYALSLLSSALGGGMSSRLFQRVREELALCYSVHTWQTFHAACGVGGVYLGTRPATAQRAVEAVGEELERVAAEGLPPDDLAQVKEQVKGQVVLSLESTAARLYRLAGFALDGEPFLGQDELLARVDGVTTEEVAEVAARYVHPDRQLVLRLGPRG
ncbi:MAG TPA: pitrilysin family protein [Longimicrobiales bacterium]|nr:pitrilysin family protein [Longimicrobiales bacterium]